MKQSLPGINIQYPISQKILSGEKTVETRTYPIPASYVNRDLFLVETPGTEGKFKARVVAIISFGESFPYKSKSEFRADHHRHLVEPGSKWDWDKKQKWGWPITKVKPLRYQKAFKGAKGIKFTKSVTIDL